MIAFWAFLDPCVLFIQLKIGIYIWDITSTDRCRNKGGILFFSIPLVILSEIGTIGHNDGFFIRCFLSLKAVFEKLAV